MKKYLYIIALAILTIAGCEKPGPENKPQTLGEKLCGEWRGAELSADAGIYISFMADGTFELYQMMDGETFELRKGKWSLEGDILSGTYNDSEKWAADYKVLIEGDTLIMISQNQGGETNSYGRCTIPAIIKENCSIVVKSLGSLFSSAL